LIRTRGELALPIAGAIAVASAASTAGLRLTDLPGVIDGGAGRFVGPLVALALLSLAGLAWRVEPVAMLCLVAASGVAAVDAIGLGRAVNAADPGLRAWPIVAAIVGFEATGTAAIAAMYIARRTARRTPRLVAAAAVAWLGVSCVIVVAAVVAGVREDPAVTWLDVATAPQAVWPHLVVGMLAVGVLVDLTPAVARARRRLAEADALAGPPATRPSGRRLIGAILDEVDPGRRRVAAEAALTERRRIASDLHASVLPALRGAIEEANELGSPELLSRRLRDLLAELEGVVLDRRFVVLDELGLVEALEWLAERIEERAGVRVELAVADGSSLSVGRPPARIEEAAFRVARLALDNALRHSGATHVNLSVDVSAEAARVTIADDGWGWDPAAAESALRAGRLGLVDMRRAAEEVGAAVEISAGPAGAGTRVAFAWSAS
jgi:signal transduction histidine kinase